MSDVARDPARPRLDSVPRDARRLDRPDRRQVLLGGGMLAAAGAAVVLRPRRTVERLPDGTLDRVVPTSIGRWKFLTTSGLVLPPQDELTEQLYDQVLTRVYAADGLPPIMLLIAYGSAQDYTLQAHLPEVCYPSSGYSISNVSRVPVSLGPGRSETATFLSAQRAERFEQVFYWLRIGTRYPATLAQERLAVVEANLRGVLPDGVLVRLSIIGDDRKAALGQIESFNQQLLASLGAAGRRLLVTG